MYITVREQAMKLYSAILAFCAILVVKLSYANDEFSQLFDLTKDNESLILANKSTVTLPSSNLTALQRLYRYINTFGSLELYTNSANNGFYIAPVYRLNLMYSPALAIKILHEATDDIISLFLTSKSNNQQYRVTEVTTEQDTQKVTIAADKAITIADILTNETSLGHIVNQLEYGVFNTTSKIFLSEIYQLESNKNLLINLRHNELRVKLLISPCSSQLEKCYLFTKLLTADITNYLLDSCKTLLHKLKAQKATKNATSDTK